MRSNLPPDLVRLLNCHATPGDESEVAEILEAGWLSAGWQSHRLGNLALYASQTSRNASRLPKMLVCAHMDSPGFIVDRLPSPESAHDGWGLVKLGGACFEEDQVRGKLKCAAGVVPVTIRRHAHPHGNQPCDYSCVAESSVLPLPKKSVRHGDRVCFASEPRMDGHVLASPFIDNRIGCWLLTRLAEISRHWRCRCSVVAGATACEEMGGFGAPVLARHLQPNLVVVLDATYATDEQQVCLGGGPVLTLSDASVLLSPALRDEIMACFDTARLPLQTEVYNYSGTDARAFPHQGIAATVLPLLLPTTGNHSPAECLDLRDTESLLKGLQAIAEHFFPA